MMHDELDRVDRVIDGREAGRVPEGWATSHRGHQRLPRRLRELGLGSLEPSTKSGRDAGGQIRRRSRATTMGGGSRVSQPSQGRCDRPGEFKGHRRSVGAQVGDMGGRHGRHYSTTEDLTAQWSGAHSRSRHRSALSRDASGLVAAVVQQHDTLEVLMLGWMDDEALRRTLTTGRVTFWSRSRQEYWRKGTPAVTSMGARSRSTATATRPLVTVEQVGAARHTGARTCSRTMTSRCRRGRNGLVTATDMLPTSPSVPPWPALDVFSTLGNRSTRHPGGPEVDGGRGCQSGLPQTRRRPGRHLPPPESAEHGGVWSRWSIVGAASHATLTELDTRALDRRPSAGVPVDGIPTDALWTRSPRWPPPPRSRACHRWTGGMVGMVGYDAVRRWERLPVTAPTPWASPELAMMLATDRAVLDHSDGSGAPGRQRDQLRRHRRARRAGLAGRRRPTGSDGARAGAGAFHGRHGGHRSCPGGLAQVRPDLEADYTTVSSAPKRTFVPARCSRSSSPNASAWTPRSARGVSRAAGRKSQPVHVPLSLPRRPTAGASPWWGVLGGARPSHRRACHHASDRRIATAGRPGRRCRSGRGTACRLKNAPEHVMLVDRDATTSGGVCRAFGGRRQTQRTSVVTIHHAHRVHGRRRPRAGDRGHEVRARSSRRTPSRGAQTAGDGADRGLRTSRAVSMGSGSATSTSHGVSTWPSPFALRSQGRSGPGRRPGRASSPTPIPPASTAGASRKQPPHFACGGDRRGHDGDRRMSRGAHAGCHRCPVLVVVATVAAPGRPERLTMRCSAAVPSRPPAAKPPRVPRARAGCGSGSRRRP